MEWYVTDFVARCFRRLLRFTSLLPGNAQDMYVIALVTQKGGSGKSTLAVGTCSRGDGERGALSHL